MRLTAPLIKGFPLKYYVQLKIPFVFINALSILSNSKISYLTAFKILTDVMCMPEEDNRLSPFHIIYQTAVQWHFFFHLKMLKCIPV